MPLAGGAADKAGNRYELKWVVRQFLRLLSGEAAWIHIEPVGTAGEGIEFRLDFQDGGTEAHQVKRQKGTAGVWSVRDLAKAGVLAGVRRYALEAGIDFHFVSTCAVKGLTELTDRARDATDLAEFERHFLPKGAVGDFDAFCRLLGERTREEGFTALRRFYPVAEDERLLADTVAAIAATYVDGSSVTACDVLFAWALENTHQRLTAHDVWSALAQHNFYPSDLANDREVSARLARCTKEYMESQRFDVGGLVIVRKEAEKVERTFIQDGKHTVFLTGAAGVGKTGVGSQVVQTFIDRGWPVFALRMDRQDPTVRKEELGRQLIGREVSPIAALAAVAQGQECLLVVEQLDAVSTISGRNPEFFVSVESMLREARAHPNMRLLLVCRAFDLENDQRFRELRAAERERCETVSVSVLAPEELQEALTHLGVKLEKLTDRQRDLLRLPLHLLLFSGGIKSGGMARTVFASPKDLFDEFLRTKRSQVSELLSAPNNFEVILSRLCEEMNRLQAVSVPRNVALEWAADVDRLVSANVLVGQPGRLAFFHESFFDYVFARGFCGSGETLLTFLCASDQDLFLRGQVRQILSYRRDEDFSTYQDEVRNCLASSEVRFHIKKLIISVVGDVDEPTVEEWRMMEERLASEEPGIADAVRSALWPSRPWFQFLVTQQILATWLMGENEVIRTFAFGYARRIASDAPSIVATVLNPLAGRSVEVDRQIVNVVAWSDAAGKSPELEGIFCKVVLNDQRDWEFQRLALSEFVQHNCYREAAAASRALGLYLKLLVDQPDVPEDLQRSRHDGGDIVSNHSVNEMVEKAPLEFARSVAEPIVSLMERHKRDDKGEPPWRDLIFHGGFQGHEFWEPEILLSGLARALQSIATEAPSEYKALMKLLVTSDCRAAHSTALRAFAVADERVKEAVIAFLADSWSHAGIWYDRFSLWEARELLKTLAPLLSNEDVKRIEPIILGLFEEWDPFLWGSDTAEKEREQLRQQARLFGERFGWRQYLLLDALPEKRLSQEGRHRQQELRRKFSKEKLEAPVSSRGGIVVSPIPKDATDMMSDSQWLAAIERYSSDDEREWLADKVIGGAEQLASVLRTHVEADPCRFAELMSRFPEETNEAYFTQIAIGLRSGELPLALLQQTSRCLHERPGRPHGRWLPGIIAKNGDQGLPNDLLDIVAWYAANDPDPKEDLWKVEASSGQPYYGGDPVSYGINTVRGSVALAIADLVGTDKRYWNYFQTVIEGLVDDPILAVRTCAADVCTQALRHDRQGAIELFMRLCDADDALLAVNSVERFVYYTGSNDWPALRPVIERMLASDVPGVREVGARQATLVALSESDARPLADQAVMGDPPMRKGVAQVLSHNLLNASFFDFCVALLLPFFNDPDKEVRAVADDWLSRIKDGAWLGELLPVAEAYIESDAFMDNPDAFFRMIEDVVDAPPELLFEAGHRFLEGAGSSASDIRTKSAFTSLSLSDLMLRAYRQAETDRGLRCQCLDLFDHVLATGAYGADRALDAFER